MLGMNSASNPVTGPQVFPLMGSFPEMSRLSVDALNYPYEAMHQLGLRCHGPLFGD
jgi:hypothetical protein